MQIGVNTYTEVAWMKGKHLQRKFPKGHELSKSLATPNGTLINDISKSARLRFAMKQLVKVCSLRLVMIMWHTIRLPNSEMKKMIE